ncbi:MAG TPA: hypothetical protein VN366_05210 [Feifaniaceae bacterium]|nr:hypothetical protein [Feifaniaceae bacterium]
MKRIKKTALLFCAAAAAMLALIGCKQLDVVGNESVASFDTVLKAIPDQVQADEPNYGWALSAPDGAVRFIWSEDYSRSPLHDAMLELDAQPFLDAGLDPEKLPESVLYSGDKLIVGTKFGGDELKYSGEITPLKAYEQIVTLYRDSIGYHTALDHYGVKLGNGNMFEWAKDMAKNDKDIVFVLNPEPFIAAGVDPDAVNGWAFAKVPMEEDGKSVEVDKFLKPFDLT